MERKYDTTFIIDGDLSQLDREAIIKRFADDLEKNDARVERIVRWGMRTLAYDINKKSRGYYVIFYYTAEPAVIKIVERDLRINENVLRYMTIKFDGEHPSYIPDEGEPDLKGQSLPDVVLDETGSDDVLADDAADDESDAELDAGIDNDDESEEAVEEDMDEETGGDEDEAVADDADDVKEEL